MYPHRVQSAYEHIERLSIIFEITFWKFLHGMANGGRLIPPVLS